MSNTSRTDWSSINSMNDDDIDTSDIPPLTDEFFSRAMLRMPSSPIVDSPLGERLRAIRTRIVESGILLLSDAELEKTIAERRGERDVGET